MKEVVDEYSQLLPGIPSEECSQMLKTAEANSNKLGAVIQEGQLSIRTLLLDPKLSPMDRKKKLAGVMNKLAPEIRNCVHPRVIREAASQATSSD